MADKFTIACTFCQKQYPVDERMVGRRVKCKNCGEVFIVPKPPPRADDPIDLSAFDQPAPVYTQPPPLPPPQPAYTAPPMYTSSAPKQRWAGNWNTGSRRAWWTVPAIVIVIALRMSGLFHFGLGDKTSSWNITSATFMTLDQKREQTAANLRLLGPELRQWAPTASRTTGPSHLYFNDLPHSTFVSPFSPNSAGTDDYRFIHLAAMGDARFEKVIVLYDNSELSASDGTTVYRAIGLVEHLSKDQFAKEISADDLALAPRPSPFPPINRMFFVPQPPMFAHPPTSTPRVIPQPIPPQPRSEGYISFPTPATQPQ